MSKKNAKHKQKKNFLWVFLVLGGVLIFATIFLFANQNGGDGGGTPKIVVDQQKIDYGDVKFGVNKTFAIKVMNTGDGTLRFSEEPYIQILEGC